jgi:hypothetical protein
MTEAVETDSEKRRSSGGKVLARIPAWSGDQNEDAARSGSFDPGNPMAFVAQLAHELGVEVLFNGRMVFRNQRVKAESPEQVREVLYADHMDPSIFLERAIIWNKMLDYDYRTVELKSAVREFVRIRKKVRKAVVIEALLRPLSLSEAADAAAEWEKLPELFDMDPQLVVACMQHFVWQVLRKQIGLEVTHHLMPVIVSPDQGAGKTRFLSALLAPLKELASAPARTSDLVDKRAISMLDYVVVVLDDMEKIARQEVENLKSLITSAEQLRRMMQTSMDVTAKQNTTLIGTSNSPINQLIPDDSGHRRFVEMPFRNGNVVKGGDPKIWPTINGLKAELLFRSVNPWLESPIVPHLEALAGHQAQMKVESKLLRWLNALNPDSAEMVAITTARGVRAGLLRDLYEAQNDVDISTNEFSKEMDALIARKQGPFARKCRDPMKCYYYVFRQEESAKTTDIQQE